MSKVAAASSPLISVVMTCYNHRRYIMEAIDSVLSQSHDNLELILVDDGSADGTSTLVHSIKDPRLTYVWQENQGPSAATNRGLSGARGDYIALMGGDDVCFRDRLAIQLEQISAGHDLVFALPTLIDDQSEKLPYYRHGSFFRANFSDASELFRTLFFEFNFLCGPTAFARRSFFKRAGLYKLGLIQLQDFELWARACRTGAKVARFEEPLLNYRIRENSSNLSSAKFMKRVPIEIKTIFSDFFSNAPLTFLRSAFPMQINLEAVDRDVSVEVDLLLLTLSHRSDLVKSVGIEKIISAMDEEDYRNEFAVRGFSLAEFFRMSNEIQPYVL